RCTTSSRSRRSRSASSARCWVVASTWRAASSTAACFASSRDSLWASPRFISATRACHSTNCWRNAVTASRCSARARSRDACCSRMRSASPRTSAPARGAVPPPPPPCPADRLPLRRARRPDLLHPAHLSGQRGLPFLQRLGPPLDLRAEPAELLPRGLPVGGGGGPLLVQRG